MRSFLPLVLLVVALGACSEQPPPALAPGESAARDSVLTLLRAADTNTFDAAFARLDKMVYQVTTRTEQIGENGEPVASHTRTYRLTRGTAERIAADSSGTFDYGGFSSFADRRRDELDFATSPAALVLPDEPAYLDPRGREVFTFALAGDTLLGDRRVRVLTVTARPGEGDDQALRTARLYLDVSGSLVGARVRRRQASALFGESSALVFFLQPTDGGWLPDRLSVDTEIRAPLTTPRRFRLDERYTFPGGG